MSNEDKQLPKWESNAETIKTVIDVLGWLRDIQKIEFCKIYDPDKYLPATIRIEMLLKYWHIDHKKLLAECRDKKFVINEIEKLGDGI